MQPRYDQKMYPPGDRVNKLQTIVSPIDNNDEGMKIHQDAWIYRTTLEAGKSLSHSFRNKDNGAYIFLIDGKVTVGDQVLKKRDALGTSEAESFEIKADTTSDVLIFEVPMA